jgi:predicted MPP superfamily phosphohydrolase
MPTPVRWSRVEKWWRSDPRARRRSSRPLLRRVSLAVPVTWPALEILHLSDIHLRRNDPGLRNCQAAALRRFARQPDLVCVTGDMCEQLADVPLLRDLLDGVHPRLGMYLIPGNHEYGVHAPAQQGQHTGLVPRLRMNRRGVRILRRLRMT